MRLKSYAPLTITHLSSAVWCSCPQNELQTCSQNQLQCEKHPDGKPTSLLKRYKISMLWEKDAFILQSQCMQNINIYNQNTLTTFVKWRSFITSSTIPLRWRACMKSSSERECCPCCPSPLTVSAKTSRILPWISIWKRVSWQITALGDFQYQDVG